MSKIDEATAQVQEQERHRLAAYLCSIIQSAENSEDGEAQTPLEKAYDNGILYAARMLLDGADEGAPWTEHCEDYAEELRLRVVPGEPAFDNNTLLVEELEPDVLAGRVMLRGGDWLVANLTPAAARDLAEAIEEAADEAEESTRE
jgi:hypothetical protein